MRILFLTGREISNARNEVLLRALRRLGEVDVVAPPQTPGSLWTASLGVAGGALPRLRKHQYDLVFVSFYGHLILRLLGRLIRPPILFDAFVSTYDTLCFDRQVFAPTSLPGRERLACPACRSSRPGGRPRHLTRRSTPAQPSGARWTATL